MKRAFSSFVLLTLCAHVCTAGVVTKKTAPQHFDRLYEATISLLTTCYEHPSVGVGVVGDSDGSIVKRLWSSSSTPVALVDTTMKMDNEATALNVHRLQVFVVSADSVKRFYSLMMELEGSVWWNRYGNFLILNPNLELDDQCAPMKRYLFVAFRLFGVLNAQSICLVRHTSVKILTINPFARRAPKQWRFVGAFKQIHAPYNVYMRTYEDDADNCAALNFPKTTNLDGYPLHFISRSNHVTSVINEKLGKVDWHQRRSLNDIAAITEHNFHLLIDNVAIAMNATPVVTTNLTNLRAAMIMQCFFMSAHVGDTRDCSTYPLFRHRLYAVTQHTGHMSQLDKILSVIDRPSRICMWIVYLITFLFFKFFVRQAVAPALLNLVRLTSGMGLTTLPQNLSPTIYLSCLFMFVVTLQAIYTGNLASLLTSTIAYPHVNTKKDLVDLGYTSYTVHDGNFVGDSMLDGRVVKISSSDECHELVMRDPLAACLLDYYSAAIVADYYGLHMSRYPISTDYIYARLSRNNPFGRRFNEIMTVWNENDLIGPLTYSDIAERLSDDLVDDEDVKGNTFRRVMTLADLGFAFVILAVGLATSTVCFVGEVVVGRVRLMIAKRRDRIQAFGAQ